MRVAVAVQHHPSRAELIPPLLERLGGPVDVVADPDPDGRPSALRTYLPCLTGHPASATHVVVVQDDAWPCEAFLERAGAALAARPDALVAFSVQGAGTPGRAVLAAHRRGESWARLPAQKRGWVPTIALGWPVDHAAAFVAFALDRYPTDYQGDDAPVGAYAYQRRVEVWATVPSLVEHPDVVPSLIPGRRASAGRNRARVAAVMADA